jgi:hypothetical protein
MLAAAFALPATAFAAAGDLSVTLVGTTAIAVDVPGGGAANYLLLEVDPADDYTTGTYTINATAPTSTSTEVTATPVLKNANGEVTYIKVPVPAGVTAGSIVVNDGAEVLNAAFTATAGIAAPEYIYGEVPMGFAEFNHFVTAGITQDKPTETFFVEGAAVAVPEQFIAAGGRGDWSTTGKETAVDVISTATYGDSVHYAPSGNMVLNYTPAQTNGVGHEVTGIKAVDVGISFDLLANATLLDEVDKGTDQSDAVLAKAATLTPKAENTIYKAQYLFADATWGARETTAHSTAPSWATTTTDVLYSNNWTTREAQINFNMTGTDSAAFWNNYLEYLYGGYVENVDTGAREPLVFLQNIFTHYAHTNIDVSINDTLFPRFDSIEIPGQNFKVVLYVKGYEDVVVEGITFKTLADTDTSIEQGTTFNVKPGDKSTWFEGNALHIQGVAAANRDAYAASATLSKGTTALSKGLYSFSNTNDELELSVEDAFFRDAYQGSYTIKLKADTEDEISKPLTFTVNKWLDRPTLSTATGAPSVADSEATALVATLADTVSFSNSEYAGAIVTSGRAVSSIVDVTADNAAVTASNVFKRDLSTEPYTLDLSTLTVSHTYRLSLITTNIATGETPSTTAVYYLKVAAASNEPISVTDPATGITVTASPNIPLDQLTITPISSLQTAGLSWLKHAERDVVAAYDIHFDSYTLAAGETLKISFPIASSVAGEGKTLLVRHGYDTVAQKFEAFEPAVSDGQIEVTVSSLSPFVIHALAGTEAGTGGTSDTGTGSTVPSTGDSSLSLLPVLLLLVLIGSLLMLGSYLRRNATAYDSSTRRKQHPAPTPRRRAH